MNYSIMCCALVALAVGSGCGGDDTAKPNAPPQDPGTIDDGGMDNVASDGGMDDVAPDGGKPLPDAGPDPDPTYPDAAIPDAGPVPTLEQRGQLAIEAIADGAVDVELPFATVTYVRPTIGDDLAAFWLQTERLGPALLVAIDPQSLSPAPKQGDQVSLHVTELTDGAVTGLRDWKVLGSGSVDHLVQALTLTAQTWTNRAEYVHEFVRVTGRVTTAFGSSGPEFEAAWFGTPGVQLGANVRMRLPTALRAATGIRNGCTIEVGPTPLWPRGDVIYYSAWTADDVAVGSCGDSSLVVDATGPTEVTLTLSRDWDPNSIIDYATHFTIDGLVVLGGSVDGGVITLQTQPQIAGRIYTLNVDRTVLDAAGHSLHVDERMKPFRGFALPAWLMVNELSATLVEQDGFDCSLIELRALSSGTLDGVQLRSRGTNLGAYVIEDFDNVYVEAGDLLVVHMDSDCNDSVDGVGDPRPAVDERDAPDELPQVDYPRNHDTARDFWDDGNGGLTAVDNVIYLRTSDGVIMDAVPIVSETDCNLFDASGVSETRLAYIADQQQWERDGGGVPDGGFVDEAFCEHAVADSDGTSFEPAGTSIQRIGDSDTNTKVDWTDLNASTWGAPNASQGDVPGSVVRVAATGPTEVVLTLNGDWDAASIVDAPNQFTIVGTVDIAVIAATVVGDTITLETESQGGGARYVLNVADTVLDVAANPLPQGERAKPFVGFSSGALLRINEINANIYEGNEARCDLIELVVLRGGNLEGMRMRSKGGNAAYTLIQWPEVHVKTGEYIVLHLDSGDCNPTGAVGEFGGMDAEPQAEHPRHYDNAYDFWDAADGITQVDNVIYVQDADVVTQDGVALVSETDCVGFNSSLAAERRVAFLADLGQWQRRAADGGGTPVGGFVDEAFCASAVADLDGTGTLVDGTSLQRTSALDTNSADDWSDVSLSTWGLPNPGQ